MCRWHGSKAQCSQTHLLHAQHPEVQPISEVNGKCKTELGIYSPKMEHILQQIAQVVNIFVMVRCLAWTWSPDRDTKQATQKQYDET